MLSLFVRCSRSSLLALLTALPVVMVGCAGSPAQHSGAAGGGGDTQPPETAGGGAGGGNDSAGNGGGGNGGAGADGSSAAGGSGVACTGTATGNCSDRLCDVMPGCTAVTPSACTGTAKPCSAFDGAALSSCGNEWGCGPGENGVCEDYVTDCTSIHNEQDCQKYSGCWWASLYCYGTIPKNCPAQTTRSSCQSNIACTWTPSKAQYCSGSAIACASMTADTCELQQGCVLTPATCSGVPTPCEGLSQSQCLMQPGCRLSNGGTRTIKPTGIQTTAPDLVASRFSIRRAQNGAGLTLEIAEVNRGSAEAPAHKDAVILSKNDVYGDADDYLLYTGNVSSPMAPYGFDEVGVKSTTIAMPAASALAPGLYYPMFVLDTGAVVKELEEANNISTLPQLYIGPDVFDLTAVTLSHTVTTPLAPADSFKLSLTVKNNGTVTASAATVAISLSLDNLAGADDLPITCTVSVSLDAGKQAEVPVTCTAPRLRGTYYVVADLDPKNTLKDVNRADNVVVAATPIVLNAPSPDLQVGEVTSSNYAPEWKGTVTLSAKVVNAGTDPAPATTVGFYLKATKLLCSAEVRALTAGESIVVSHECTLDVSMVGKLPLRAEVDPKDLISEASDSNNSTNSAQDLVVTPPDINLVAQGVGIVAGGTEGKVGQKVDVFFDIRNTGTKDAPPFRFIFYASVDTTITEDDTEFCIRDATTGQQAGTKTENASTACTIPTMPTGEYYIGMIVDTKEEVPETSETDNIAVDSVNKLTVK